MNLLKLLNHQAVSNKMSSGPGDTESNLSNNPTVSFQMLLPGEVILILVQSKQSSEY
jgi:hypothetical protein